MTGSEPAARAAGRKTGALQPQAARVADGKPGTSGAAAARAEPAGATARMAAHHGAGGVAAAAAAAWLAGVAAEENVCDQRTFSSRAAGAEAASPAEATGQASRPFGTSSAAYEGRLPGAQAALRQPYISHDDWGGGGAPRPSPEPDHGPAPPGQAQGAAANACPAPSAHGCAARLPGDWGGRGALNPELQPASACAVGRHGNAGASPAPAARPASPCRHAEDAGNAGNAASAGPSDPLPAVHLPSPCRPAEGASVGAPEVASPSHPVSELPGPAGSAQTRSCRRAEEGGSAASRGAAQRSPRGRPAPSAGVAFKRITLPISSGSNGDERDSDAAPAGAAVGAGSAPPRRPAARSTSIAFTRMALPDSSDSDREGGGEQARSSAEPPAEPGCVGPRQGLASSAPVAKCMAPPDSSGSEAAGGSACAAGVRPAQTGAQGGARVQDPSAAGQELQSDASGHAGGGAAEEPGRGGAPTVAAASGSPAMPCGPSAGTSRTAAAPRIGQRVAFKRVRMKGSSDESEADGEGSRGGSKRMRRSPPEDSALSGPAEGTAGQAAEPKPAAARQAAPGRSSAAACSGVPATASCEREPGRMALPTVAARSDTELHVDGQLTRWTRVRNLCLSSTCIMLTQSQLMWLPLRVPEHLHGQPWPRCAVPPSSLQPGQAVLADVHERGLHALQEDDRAILSAVIVRAGGQPSDAVFERLAAEMAAAAGRAGNQGGAHAPAHIRARFGWLARRLGLQV